MKTVPTHPSLSDPASEVLRAALEEYQEDLAAFEERMDEPTISYKVFLNAMKAAGK